jgi:hypothetical protein
MIYVNEGMHELEVPPPIAVIFERSTSTPSTKLEQIFLPARNFAFSKGNLTMDNPVLRTKGNRDQNSS